MAAISRYRDRQVIINDNELYRDVFDDRGLKYIVQYATPRFSPLTIEQRSQLQRITHVWSLGDRFFKLAHKHYSKRPELWWVIAWYNEKPTETHVSPGDIIYIPLPLDRVLSYYGI